MLYIRLWIAVCLFATSLLGSAANDTYRFISNQWLTMADGTKLSVNYWYPISYDPKQRFPILLEVLPYRKDDSYFIRDHMLQSYFAQHGFIVARVDLRGTGSSEGRVPNREYSDQELSDIRDIIFQLAKRPDSNGRIGMQGISWSAFNALMMAMDAPSPLKGILIAHGSDDLYGNDIHFIDGALHLDIFSVEIDTDNFLPQSPHYPLNAAYFSNRFYQKPWIFHYLHHQRDGIFWQYRRSFQNHPLKTTIPIFAFAGLLDGYRDYVLPLQHLSSPIKIAMGPQNHDWPNGSPGPVYDWRLIANQWWHRILDKNTINTPSILKSDFLVFMRKSMRPTLHLKQTPGQYWRYALPLTQQRQKRLYLADKKKLLSTMHDAATNTKIDILKYQPSSGMGVLNWWGEPTSDMRLAQAGTLSYESEKLTHSLTLFGQPNIFIRVAADAPLAHWIVRLEDVNPDGSITFITGGLKNAAQRFSREKPNAIPLHQFFNLHFPLHFTTWTFSKGHKIRVVITNAQFPMIWPTPYPMTTKLMVNGPSKIDLPIAPTPLDKNPFLPPVTTSSVSLPSNTNVLRDIPFTSFKVIHHKDRVIARAKEGYRLKIKQSVYDCLYSVQYSVHNKFPANASFIGKGRVIITQTHPKRMIKIQSFFHIRSDLKYFYVTVTRKIIMPNQKIHSHTWKERIKRDFQ